LGYTRGIVRTLFVIVSYTIALLLTLAISPWVMSLIIKWFNADKMFALIFGSIGTMLILILLFHWMFKSIEKYLRKSKLGAFSKSIGGVVMMLVAMIVYSILIWAIVQFGWIGEKTTSKSYSYPVLSQVAHRMRSFAEEFRPLFRRYWDLMDQTFQEGKEKPVQQ
ncbi:MAG TPA: CvpA family protein, partial [Saprospiraceae bacterium]|nr:CvpA family protein [Saprospiraceae bacterium]